MWKVFLELLRAHGIKRVIDVRSIPRSRHNPQFTRETLSAKLRSARIGYVHLRKLGGRRHARRDSLNMGWHNTSFRGFADYMQTPDFEAGLQRKSVNVHKYWIAATPRHRRRRCHLADI
jgi:hypothetical protein